MITALVTGIGGTRSIAVMNALRLAAEPVRIIGTDANYFNAGSYQCDKAYVVPPASDEKYLSEVERIISEERIDIIYATVEKEVACLAKQKAYLEKKYDITVMVPETEILDICFDKYKTQTFLQSNGHSYIPCIYCKDRDEIAAFATAQGFPLIRKPVFGYGSKGLSIIRTQAELEEMATDETYVLQKYIENDDTETYYNTELNEYTAEVFVNADGSSGGGINLKRALHGGETVAGYLVKDEAIVAELSDIARHLDIKGPCNCQYRKQGGKLYVFEINPLFSGTTSIRAGLGFNSVLMAVRSFVQQQHGSVAQAALQERYFMRYLREVFVDKTDIARLRDTGTLTNEQA